MASSLASLPQFSHRPTSALVPDEGLKGMPTPAAVRGGPYPYGIIRESLGSGNISDPSVYDNLFGSLEGGYAPAKVHDTRLEAINRFISVELVPTVMLLSNILRGSYWNDFIPIIKTKERILKSHQMFFNHQGLAELAPEESAPGVYSFNEEYYTSRTSRWDQAIKFNIEAASSVDFVMKEIAGLIALVLQTQTLTREMCTIGALLSAAGHARVKHWQGLYDFESYYQTIRRQKMKMAILQREPGRVGFPKLNGILDEEISEAGGAPANIIILSPETMSLLRQKYFEGSYSDDGLVRDQIGSSLTSPLTNATPFISGYLARTYDNPKARGLAQEPRVTRPDKRTDMGDVYVTSNRPIQAYQFGCVMKMNPTDKMITMSTHAVVGGVPSDYIVGQPCKQKAWDRIKIENEQIGGTMVDLTLKSMVEATRMFERTDPGYLVKANGDSQDGSSLLYPAGETHNTIDTKRITFGSIRASRENFELMLQGLRDKPGAPALFAGWNLERQDNPYAPSDNANAVLGALPADDVLKSPFKTILNATYCRKNILTLIENGIYPITRMVALRPFRTYKTSGMVKLTAGPGTAVYAVQMESTRASTDATHVITYVIYTDESGVFIINYKNIAYEPVATVVGSIMGSGVRLEDNPGDSFASTLIDHNSNINKADIIPLVVAPDLNPPNEIFLFSSHVKELQNIQRTNITNSKYGFDRPGMNTAAQFDTFPIANKVYDLDEIANPAAGWLIDTGIHVKNYQDSYVRYNTMSMGMSDSETQINYSATSGEPINLLMGANAFAEYTGYGSLKERNNETADWKKKLVPDTVNYKGYQLRIVNDNEIK